MDTEKTSLRISLELDDKKVRDGIIRLIKSLEKGAEIPIKAQKLPPSATQPVPVTATASIPGIRVRPIESFKQADLEKTLDRSLDRGFRPIRSLRDNIKRGASDAGSQLKQSVTSGFSDTAHSLKNAVLEGFKESAPGLISGLLSPIGIILSGAAFSIVDPIGRSLGSGIQKAIQDSFGNQIGSIEVLGESLSNKIASSITGSLSKIVPGFLKPGIEDVRFGIEDRIRNFVGERNVRTAYYASKAQQERQRLDLEAQARPFLLKDAVPILRQITQAKGQGIETRTALDKLESLLGGRGVVSQEIKAAILQTLDAVDRQEESLVKLTEFKDTFKDAIEEGKKLLEKPPKGVEINPKIGEQLKVGENFVKQLEKREAQILKNLADASAKLEKLSTKFVEYSIPRVSERVISDPTEKALRTEKRRQEQLDEPFLVRDALTLLKRLGASGKDSLEVKKILPQLEELLKGKGVINPKIKKILELALNQQLKDLNVNALLSRQRAATFQKLASLPKIEVTEETKKQAASIRQKATERLPEIDESQAAVVKGLKEKLVSDISDEEFEKERQAAAEKLVQLNKLRAKTLKTLKTTPTPEVMDKIAASRQQLTGRFERLSQSREATENRLGIRSKQLEKFVKAYVDAALPKIAQRTGGDANELAKLVATPEKSVTDEDKLQAFEKARPILERLQKNAGKIGEVDRLLTKLRLMTEKTNLLDRGLVASVSEALTFISKQQQVISSAEEVKRGAQKFIDAAGDLEKADKDTLEEIEQAKQRLTQANQHQQQAKQAIKQGTKATIKTVQELVDRTTFSGELLKSRTEQLSPPETAEQKNEKAAKEKEKRQTFSQISKFVERRSGEIKKTIVRSGASTGLDVDTIFKDVDLKIKEKHKKIARKIIDGTASVEEVVDETRTFFIELEKKALHFFAKNSPPVAPAEPEKLLPEQENISAHFQERAKQIKETIVGLESKLGIDINALFKLVSSELDLGFDKIISDLKSGKISPEVATERSKKFIDSVERNALRFAKAKKKVETEIVAPESRSENTSPPPVKQVKEAPPQTGQIAELRSALSSLTLKEIEYVQKQLGLTLSKTVKGKQENKAEKIERILQESDPEKLRFAVPATVELAPEEIQQVEELAALGAEGVKEVVGEIASELKSWLSQGIEAKDVRSLAELEGEVAKARRQLILAMSKADKDTLGALQSAQARLAKIESFARVNRQNIALEQQVQSRGVASGTSAPQRVTSGQPMRGGQPLGGQSLYAVSEGTSPTPEEEATIEQLLKLLDSQEVRLKKDIAGAAEGSGIDTGGLLEVIDQAITERKGKVTEGVLSGADRGALFDSILSLFKTLRNEAVSFLRKTPQSRPDNVRETTPEEKSTIDLLLKAFTAQESQLRKDITETAKNAGVNTGELIQALDQELADRKDKISEEVISGADKGAIFEEILSFFKTLRKEAFAYIKGEDPVLIDAPETVKKIAKSFDAKVSEFVKNLNTFSKQQDVDISGLAPSIEDRVVAQKEELVSGLLSGDVATGEAIDRITGFFDLLRKESLRYIQGQKKVKSGESLSQKDALNKQELAAIVTSDFSVQTKELKKKIAQLSAESGLNLSKLFGSIKKDLVKERENLLKEIESGGSDISRARLKALFEKNQNIFSTLESAAITYVDKRRKDGKKSFKPAEDSTTSPQQKKNQPKPPAPKPPEVKPPTPQPSEIKPPAPKELTERIVDLALEEVFDKLNTIAGEKFDRSQLPKLEPREQTAGGAAFYIVGENAIGVSSGLIQKLEHGLVDLSDIELLIHELRHAFQFAFGKNLDITQPAIPLNRKDLKGEPKIQKHVEESVQRYLDQRSSLGLSPSKRAEEAIRALETDAYATASELKDALSQKIFDRVQLLIKEGVIPEERVNVGRKYAKVLEEYNLRQEITKKKISKNAQETGIDSGELDLLLSKAIEARGQGFFLSINKDFSEKNIDLVTQELRGFFSEISSIATDYIEAVQKGDLSKLQSLSSQLISYTSSNSKQPTPKPPAPKELMERVADLALKEVFDELNIIAGRKFNRSQLPDLRPDHTPGSIIQAQYVPEKNQVGVSPGLIQKLEHGVVDRNDIELLIHELRHAFQFAFGKNLDVTRSAVPLNQPKDPKTEALIRNAADQSLLYFLNQRSAMGLPTSQPMIEGLRNLELDAYSTALELTPVLVKKVSGLVQQLISEGLIPKERLDLGRKYTKSLEEYDLRNALVKKQVVSSAQKAGIDSHAIELAVSQVLATRREEFRINLEADFSQKNIDRVTQEFREFFDEISQVASNYIEATKKGEISKLYALSSQLDNYLLPPNLRQKSPKSQNLGSVQSVSVSGGVGLGGGRSNDPDIDKELRDLAAHQSEELRQQIEELQKKNKSSTRRSQLDLEAEVEVQNLKALGKDPVKFLDELGAPALEKFEKEYQKSALLRVQQIIDRAKKGWRSLREQDTISGRIASIVNGEVVDFIESFSRSDSRLNSLYNAAQLKIPEIISQTEQLTAEGTESSLAEADRLIEEVEKVQATLAGLKPLVSNGIVPKGVAQASPEFATALEDFLQATDPNRLSEINGGSILNNIRKLPAIADLSTKKMTALYYATQSAIAETIAQAEQATSRGTTESLEEAERLTEEIEKAQAALQGLETFMENGVIRVEPGTEIQDLAKQLQEFFDRTGKEIPVAARNPLSDTAKGLVESIRELPALSAVSAKKITALYHATQSAITETIADIEIGMKTGIFPDEEVDRLTSQVEKAQVALAGLGAFLQDGVVKPDSAEQVLEFTNALREFYSETGRDLPPEARNLNDLIDSVGDNLGKAGEAIESKKPILEDAKNVIVQLVKGFLLARALEFGRNLFAQISEGAIQAYQDVQRLTKTLEYATGDAAKSFEYIGSLSDNLGLPIQEAANSFSLFAASVKGSGIEKDSERIFSAISKGVSQFGLDANAANGVFTAIQQIASKGVVSAEEFRQQLGERLPVATSLGVKALQEMANTGVVTAEELGKVADSSGKVTVTASDFVKFLNSGKLLSEQFLPALAEQFDAAFGSERVETLQASLARYGNQIKAVQVAFGKEIAPLISKGSGAASAALGLLAQNMKSVVTAVKVLTVTGILALDLSIKGGLLGSLGRLVETLVGAKLASISASIATLGYKTTLQKVAPVLGKAVAGAVLFEGAMRSVGLAFNTWKSITEDANNVRKAIDDVNDSIQKLNANAELPEDGNVIDRIKNWQKERTERAKNAQDAIAFSEALTAADRASAEAAKAKGDPTKQEDAIAALEKAKAAVEGATAADKGAEAAKAVYLKSLDQEIKLLQGVAKEAGNLRAVQLDLELQLKNITKTTEERNAAIAESVAKGTLSQEGARLKELESRAQSIGETLAANRELLTNLRQQMDDPSFASRQDAGDVQQQAKELEGTIRQQREEFARSQTEIRNASREERLKDFDEAREILEAQTKTGLVTRQQAADAAIKIEEMRAKDELRVVQEQQRELDSDDKEGKEALKVREAQILANLAEARTQAFQEQIDLAEQASQKELNAVKLTEAQKLQTIEEGLAKGALTQAEAEKQRSQLTQTRTQAEIQLEERKAALLQQLLKDPKLVGEQRTVIEQQFAESITQIQQMRTEVMRQQAETARAIVEESLNLAERASQKELNVVKLAEAQKLRVIEEGLAKGTLTQAEAGKQRLRLTMARTQTEIQLEERKTALLQQLLKDPKLVSGQRTAIEQQLTESMTRIQQLGTEIVQQQAEIARAIVEESLNALESKIDEDLDVAQLSETQKQLQIQQLQNRGVIDAEEAEKRKAKATEARVGVELAAERRKANEVRSLLQQTENLAPEQRKQLENQLRESQKSIVGKQLEIEQAKAKPAESKNSSKGDSTGETTSLAAQRQFEAQVRTARAKIAALQKGLNEARIKGDIIATEQLNARIKTEKDYLKKIGAEETLEQKSERVAKESDLARIKRTAEITQLKSKGVLDETQAQEQLAQIERDRIQQEYDLEKKKFALISQKLAEQKAKGIINAESQQQLYDSEIKLAELAQQLAEKEIETREQAIAQIAKQVEDVANKARLAEQERITKISQLKAQGILNEIQAQEQLAQIDKERIEREISLERRKYAELSKLAQGGTDEGLRDEIYNSQLKLAELAQQLAEQEITARERAIAQIAKRAEDVARKAQLAEQERITKISQLKAKGVLDEIQAQERLAQIDKERIEREISLERRKYAELSKLAQSGADEGLKDEIYNSQLKLAELAQQLAEKEIEARERAIAQIESKARLNQIALEKELVAQEELASVLQHQAELLEAKSSLMQKQAELADAVASLEKSRLEAESARTQSQIDALSQAAELRSALSNPDISDDARSQIEALLKQLGQANKSEEQLLQERDRQQQKLAQFRIQQLEAEQEQARRQLEIDRRSFEIQSQQEELRARAALTEAQIAQSKSQGAIADAQSALSVARQRGDKEAIAQAELGLKQAKLGAEQAQQQLDVAEQNLSINEELRQLQEELLQLQEEQLSVQQQSEREQLNSQLQQEEIGRQFDAINRQIEQQNKLKEMGAELDKRRKGLSTELLELQKQLASAQGATTQAALRSVEVGIQGQVSIYDRALQLRKQIDDESTDPRIRDAALRQLEAIGMAGMSEREILEAKLAREQDLLNLEQQKMNSRQKDEIRQMKFEHQMQELREKEMLDEAKLQKMQAEKMLQEAKIAQIKAAKSGDSEQIKLADMEMQIATQGLSLAQERIRAVEDEIRVRQKMREEQEKELGQRQYAEQKEHENKVRYFRSEADMMRAAAAYARKFGDHQWLSSHSRFAGGSVSPGETYLGGELGFEAIKSGGKIARFVGLNGPELFKVPQPSMVIPHHETMKMMLGAAMHHDVTANLSDARIVRAITTNTRAMQQALGILVSRQPIVQNYYEGSRISDESWKMGRIGKG